MESRRVGVYKFVIHDLRPASGPPVPTVPGRPMNPKKMKGVGELHAPGVQCNGKLRNGMENAPF